VPSGSLRLTAPKPTIATKNARISSSDAITVMEGAVKLREAS
jgi:hypothetical protein